MLANSARAIAARAIAGHAIAGRANAGHANAGFANPAHGRPARHESGLRVGWGVDVAERLHVGVEWSGARRQHHVQRDEHCRRRAARLRKLGSVRVAIGNAQSCLDRDWSACDTEHPQKPLSHGLNEMRIVKALDQPFLWHLDVTCIGFVD